LDVELDRGRAIPFRGVGGLTFGYFGDVTMELRQSPRSYRWAARVAFLHDEDVPGSEKKSDVYLGHTGFFRYFHANFDYQRGRVSLHPNGLFVGRPG